MISLRGKRVLIKSSNGVEDEGKAGSTGISEEEPEWDKQNRHPQSHAYNDEQEHNVNAAKKKRNGMAAKAIRNLPLQPSKKNPAVQRHQNPDKKTKRLEYGSTDRPMVQRNQPYRKKEIVQSVVGHGAAPSLDPSVAEGDVMTDAKNPDAPEPRHNVMYRPGPGDKPYRKSLLGDGFFVVVSLLKAIKQVKPHVRGGHAVGGYTQRGKDADPDVDRPSMPKPTSSALAGNKVFRDRSGGAWEYWTESDGDRVRLSEDGAKRMVQRGAHFVDVLADPK